MAGAAVQLVGVPAFGALSDRLGRRPVFLFGAAFGSLMAFPFFWLIDSGRPELLMAALVLGAAVGNASAWLTVERLPTAHVRVQIGAERTEQLPQMIKVVIRPLDHVLI
jgi:MFS family permease